MTTTSDEVAVVENSMLVSTTEQRTLESKSSFRIDEDENPTTTPTPGQDDSKQVPSLTLQTTNMTGMDDGGSQSGAPSELVAPLSSTPMPKAPSQQQGGDLATANRLLRSCRNLIDQLQKQIAVEREEKAKIREEFTKYKVRVELARKNSEMEISNLSEVNLKFKQYNVVSHDVQAELDALKRRYEQVDRERTEAKAEIVRLKDQVGSERAARTRAEDDLEHVRQKAVLMGPEALAKARADMAEELNDVKREYRAFRERAQKTLEEKEGEIQRARTSTEAATELAYLRDVIIKYLASANDPTARTSMEAAIASVLRFNEAELEFVRGKRRTDAGWKGALSTLGM